MLQCVLGHIEAISGIYTPLQETLVLTHWCMHRHTQTAIGFQVSQNASEVSLFLSFSGLQPEGRSQGKQCWRRKFDFISHGSFNAWVVSITFLFPEDSVQK